MVTNDWQIPVSKKLIHEYENEIKDRGKIQEYRLVKGHYAYPDKDYDAKVTDIVYNTYDERLKAHVRFIAQRKAILYIMILMIIICNVVNQCLNIYMIYLDYTF